MGLDEPRISERLRVISGYPCRNNKLDLRSMCKTYEWEFCVYTVYTVVFIMYASLLVQVIISQQPQLEPEDISL